MERGINVRSRVERLPVSPQIKHEGLIESSYRASEVY